MKEDVRRVKSFDLYEFMNESQVECDLMCLFLSSISMGQYSHFEALFLRSSALKMVLVDLHEMGIQNEKGFPPWAPATMFSLASSKQLKKGDPKFDTKDFIQELQKVEEVILGSKHNTQ